MRILSIGNEYSKEIVPGRISTAKGAVHITKTAKTTNNTNSIVLGKCLITSPNENRKILILSILHFDNTGKA